MEESKLYEVTLVRSGGMGMSRYETTIEQRGWDEEDAKEKAISNWTRRMAFQSRMYVICTNINCIS